MSNDIVQTRSYTSTDQISGQQAAALEQGLESDLLSQIDPNKLTDLEVKLARGDNLSEADTELLLQMSKGLTAKDIDGMVSTGKIDRKMGDMLLAAGTLAAFNEDSTTAADVTKGLNKIFVDMSAEDREFTLSTFAQQGDVARRMDVTKDGDGQLSAAYQLTSNGQDLGPDDLPTTPAIQRAAMFLMSDSGNAGEAGAVKAFTNWDFATAEDQMSATLKGLPNYENLSPTTAAEFAKYMTAAGSVAAGYPTAATEDVSKLQAADAKIETIDNNLKDLNAVLDAVNAAKAGGLVDTKGVTYTDSGGHTRTVDSFLDAHPEISYPNKDGDEKLGGDESDALVASLRDTINVQQSYKKVQELIKSGASDSVVAQANDDALDMQYLANIKSAVREQESDHKAKKFVKLDDVKVLNPRTHQEVSLNDALKEIDVAFNNKDNDAGISHLRNLRTRDRLSVEKDLPKLLDALDDRSSSVQHRFDAAVARGSGIEGADEIAAKLDANTRKEEDLAKALAVMELTLQNDKGLVNIHKLKFDSSLGEKSMKDFLSDYNIDFENKGGQKKINHKRAEEIRDELKSELANVKADSAKLNQDLSDLVASQPAPAAPPPQSRTGYSAQPAGSMQAQGSGQQASGASPQQQANQPAMDSADQAVSVNWNQPVSSDSPDSLSSQFPTFDDVMEQQWGVDLDVDEMSFGDIRSDYNPRKEGDWDASKEHSFHEAMRDLRKGEVTGTDELKSLGFSDSEIIDIGLLMFVVMSERMEHLGNQIQDIIKSQRANTNAQKDMSSAIAKLNTMGEDAKLSDQTITLSDGSSVGLKDFLDKNGVEYELGDEGKMSQGQIDAAVSNAKGKSEGLANEGQMINNELTMLSSKYQQAVNLSMNVLEKFDAMKEKIIGKIRGG